MADPYAITIDAGMTINDVVSLSRSRLLVLARHRADACCGGQATSAEAAAEKGLSVDDLLVELRAQTGRDAAVT